MLPGVIRGPSREYGRIGASADSLELIKANPFACAGLLFRLKMAPINVRFVDLGIIFTGSDSARFVAGARLSRIPSFYVTFRATKLQDSFIHSPHRSFSSLPHNRFVGGGQRGQRTPQPFQSHLMFCLFDPTSTDLISTYERQVALRQMDHVT